MKVTKMRTNCSIGKIPKGLEIQVVSNGTSPTTAEIAQALMNAGCDEKYAKDYASYRGRFEVIK